jgi:p-cumate 2,3-dioxygenase alpha subunit
MGHGEPSGFVFEDTDRGVFRVDRRAFTDPEVLELERARIFDRSWLYVGHESEVRRNGEFRTRRVAGRPVIFVRGKDDRIRVLLNTCTHRGATVCRHRSGVTHTFQCSYHAWTFDNCGKLIGVPGREAYGDDFPFQELGLAQPAQVASYRGFVFACFDPGTEPLEQYLAGAREYLDLVCDQSEAGMEVVGGTQSYGARANWKLLAENSVDGYHAAATHQRYLQFLFEAQGFAVTEAKQLRSLPGRALDLGHGHAVIEYEAPWGRPVAKWAPAFGEALRGRLEQKRERLEALFGRSRAHRIAETSRNLFIFPNLVVNDIMAVTVRTFFPLSPDAMEISAWALAPVDETPEERAVRLDNFLTFLGPGGFATPDDLEALEACQIGFANREVRWSDISKGARRAEPRTDDELQMRVFWRWWQRCLVEAGR